MGERNARVGGGGDGRGDARDDLEGHALLPEDVRLLAAASEDEGVSPFQSYDAAPLSGPVGEEGADGGLGASPLARDLADVD